MITLSLAKDDGFVLEGEDLSFDVLAYGAR
jgi:hypothetical protein